MSPNPKRMQLAPDDDFNGQSISPGPESQQLLARWGRYRLVQHHQHHQLCIFNQLTSMSELLLRHKNCERFLPMPLPICVQKTREREREKKLTIRWKKQTHTHTICVISHISYKLIQPITRNPKAVTQFQLNAFSHATAPPPPLTLSLSLTLLLTHSLPLRVWPRQSCFRGL